MYDPFATPPAPGTVATTSVPAAPPSALAAIAQRMRGNGQMNDSMRGPMRDQMRLDKDAYKQAKMDWRTMQPMFDNAAGMPAGWQQQMMDWRAQRPMRADYRMQRVAPGEPYPGA